MLHVVREIALGSASIDVRAGDFRILRTTLPPRFEIPPHAHRCHNLAYTVTGGVVESLDHEQVNARPGDVVLKPAGVLHDDIFDARETTTLQLEWSPKATPLPDLSFEQVLRFREDPVASVAARLYAELHIRDTAMPLVVEGLALELLGRIVRSRAPRPAAVPRWLSRVMERLHGEDIVGFGIRDLAAEAGVSADFLARRFRLAYGMTVGRYLRRLRLERAATELLRPDPPLAEIALRAGFVDQAHFTREFRRAFGVPPGAYRRRATM